MHSPKAAAKAQHLSSRSAGSDSAKRAEDQAAAAVELGETRKACAEAEFFRVAGEDPLGHGREQGLGAFRAESAAAELGEALFGLWGSSSEGLCEGSEQRCVGDEPTSEKALEAEAKKLAIFDDESIRGGGIRMLQLEFRELFEQPLKCGVVRRSVEALWAALENESVFAPGQGFAAVGRVGFEEEYAEIGSRRKEPKGGPAACRSGADDDEVEVLLEVGGPDAEKRGWLWAW